MTRTAHRIALPIASLAAIALLIVCWGCDDKATEPKAPVHRLVVENATWPSWSPDGTELAFSRASAASKDVWEIWRVSLAYGKADTLLAHPNGSHPMWLPDGERIVYYEWTGAFAIYYVNTGVAALWPVEGIWDDPGFSLSPDGSELVYTKHIIGGKDEVWVLDLTDGSTRYLVDGWGGSISPDGLWIAYSTEDDSLAIAPMGGGDVLTLEPGGMPKWTPDSKYVVYSGFGADESVELFAVSRDGSLRQQLTDEPEMSCLYGAISPRGNKVAYVKSEGEFGPHEVWVVSLRL